MLRWRDSVLKGERFRGGEIQCWRERDSVLRFSVEGREIQSLRERAVLKGERFSVEVKSFLKVIFCEDIATV